MAQRHALSFPLLLDPGNQVARAFGLVFTLPDYLQEIYRRFGLDLPRFNGDESWSLPLPARYVIAADGSIRAAAVSVDYTCRPEPEATLAILRSL